MTRKTKKQLRKEALIKKIAALLVLILFSIIGAFSLGFIGRLINSSFRVIFGQYPEPIFLSIILFSLAYLFNVKILKKEAKRIWIAYVLFLVTYVLAFSFILDPNLIGKEASRFFNDNLKTIFNDPKAQAYGGYLGANIYALLTFLVDRLGAIIINVFLGIITTILFFKIENVIKVLNKFKVVFITLGNLIKKILVPAKQKPKVKKDIFVPEPIDSSNEEEVIIDTNKKAAFMSAEEVKLKEEKGIVQIELPEDEKPAEIKTEPITFIETRSRRFKNYQLPPVTLLDAQKGTGRNSSNVSSAKDKGKRVIEVLSQFGIEAELLDIHIGPSVTKFEIKPDSNVKISKISSIQDNIMMELAVTSLRIEAPIPGKPAVGIEIPNVEMTPVRLRDIIVNTKQFYDKDDIWVALGKDLSGKPVSIALNKMPHLLIAGATGSGKSVCINSIISSILLSKRPEELKLILIDPKKVEFTPYVEIPHLMTEVVTDPNLASQALRKVVERMEERYETFSKNGVRNITAYNKLVEQDPERLKMPWIVVIIDELADLMAVAGKEVETSIQRITQLARAAGIHLIVATQRPSVDVVTGVIKANIPSRIAFAVSSAVDSRTIIDTTGAEKLLGYGDMLYIPMGDPSPTRLQGVYVSDEEVNTITQYTSEQAKPQFDAEFEDLDNQKPNKSIEDLGEDELFEDAIEVVITNQRASTSYLQRMFRIGYNRAASIMDDLEAFGIVGPQDGSRPRDVLYQTMEDYENRNIITEEID